MNIRARHLFLAALAAGGVAVAGCGGDDEPKIPRDDASAIISQLQEADRRLAQDPPVCGDLRRDFPKLEALVEALPGEVDSDIRESLDDGVAHLRDLIEAECIESQQQQDDDDTTDTTDTTTDTEPPTTTDTEPPTTTDTEPPTTTDTEPPPPPDEGDGDGNGSGGVPPGQQKKRDLDAGD